MTNFYYIIKRLFDLCISGVFFTVLSPVYIIVALAIFRQDGHSPLYSHIRIGKDKKPFRFYKFRSMIVNADEVLFKNKDLYNKMRSGVNKVEDDPRITKVGHFIRKYSLDELPQILNVLKGEMSFIGPRALRPDEFEGYEKQSDENARKLSVMTSVKPGITGLWQVSGRSNIDFETRMNMECDYAKNLSPWLDLKILIKTPLAVLKGEGAY